MASVEMFNHYEEARKQRLLENKRRFEDLGILSISKSLTELTKSPTKMKERHFKLKAHKASTVEPRRSSRARNPICSYSDDIDIERPCGRKRSSFSSSWASYLARPLAEVKSATYEERSLAMECAADLQSNLQSGNPSFTKSMVRSHVYSCFWLGLPSWFCEKHLPKSTVDIVLEDEEGNEYDAVYIGTRSGLSGGWRGFALHYKLDDGDAVVFELIEPTRFKVYIVRASNCSRNGKKIPEKASECSTQNEDTPSEVDNHSDENETNSKKRKKSVSQSKGSIESNLKRRKKSVSQSKGSIESKKVNPTRASKKPVSLSEGSIESKKVTPTRASKKPVSLSKGSIESKKVNQTRASKKPVSQSKVSVESKKVTPTRASKKPASQSKGSIESKKVYPTRASKEPVSQSKGSVKSKKVNPTRVSARQTKMRNEITEISIHFED